MKQPTSVPSPRVPGRVPTVVLGALLLCLAAAGPGQAQGAGDISVSVHGGLFQYDFVGVGSARHLIVRADRSLTRNLLLEGSFGHARLAPEPGARVTVITPELQLHFQWPVGRLAPYVGAGAGSIIALPGEGQDERDSLLALSAAGGVRGRLTDRLGAAAELRLRGGDTISDWGFTHSTSEWTVGLSWRL